LGEDASPVDDKNETQSDSKGTFYITSSLSPLSHSLALSRTLSSHTHSILSHAKRFPLLLPFSKPPRLTLSHPYYLKNKQPLTSSLSFSPFSLSLSFSLSIHSDLHLRLDVSILPFPYPSRTKCNKTCCIHNKLECLYPIKPFQPSLMFASKARSLPYRASLR